MEKEQKQSESIDKGISYVLVYKKDGNVFPLIRKAVKCSFNGRVLGLSVDNKEIFLRVWGLRNMLNQFLARTWSMERFKPTPTPARSRPVTES